MNIMKKKIYMLLLIFAVISLPITVNAETCEVRIDCNKTEVSVNEEITCDIIGISDYNVGAFQGQFDLNDEKIEFVGYSKNSIWSMQSVDDNKISVTGREIDFVSGEEYVFLTFSVKVKKTGSITIKDVNVGADGNESWLYDNPKTISSKTITVSDSGSTGGDDTGSGNTGGDGGGEDSSTEPVYYTATFRGNGGGSIPDDECEAVNGSCTITPTTEPTLAGNKFVGWSTDSNCPQNKINSSTLTLTGNTTFYACWEEVSSTEPEKTVYKVSFSDSSYVDSLGGNVPSCTPETGKTSCTVNISNLPKPVKSGYTFTGWNTNSNCTGSLVQSTLTLSKETTALYPCWKKNSTTGSGNNTGGSGNTGDNTGSTGNTGGNVEKNPQTSDTLLYVVLAVGLVAFGYAMLYFKNSKKEN